MATMVEPPWTFVPALRRMADQLVADYKICGEERGKLHDLSYDLDDSNAELALDLLTLPSDEVINIARMVEGGLPGSEYKRFTDVLAARSSWSHALALVEWLRFEMDYPQVASLIERTDYLRLILLSMLAPAEASKQSA